MAQVAQEVEQPRAHLQQQEVRVLNSPRNLRKLTHVLSTCLLDCQRSATAPEVTVNEEEVAPQVPHHHWGVIHVYSIDVEGYWRFIEM